VADSPIDQQWESIQRKVSEALTSNFPMEGKKNKLVLNGPIIIDDKSADHADLKSQEDAKLNGRTWGAPVLADVSLIDKETGQQLDRTKIKLLTLPKPTQRYSYIVDGNEWQVDNLWRLRSGVYAHIKQNGEMQAEFNLHKPFAKSPRLYIPFSPEKRQFKLKYESSNFPLYSILKTLGVPDEDMKKQWGNDIYKANVTSPAKIEKDVNSLYEKLSARGVTADGDTLQHKAQAILDTFHEAKLIPDTTKATLGKPIDHVSGEALLLASKRILEVARGDIPPDDRDSLVFKELHTVDDFLHETLTKYKTQRTLNQKVGHNIDRQGKVRDILSGELFSRPVIEFFSKDTLSRNPEQVNPLEMMSNHRATTIIAPEMGGIKNERSVTGEMTLINPSHLGFLDPIHTPECFTPDTEVFTSRGWKRWSDITDSDSFACLVDDHLEFHLPSKLHASHYEGKMYGAKTGKIDYLVTPNHRMYVRPYAAPGCSKYRIDVASEIHGKPRTFLSSHQPYQGKQNTLVFWGTGVKDGFFELPEVAGNNSSKIVDRIPLEDWAEFMGWFLSEGCVTYKEETSSYLVRISQSAHVNKEECERIEALLDRLPWKWCQDSTKTNYAIGVKQLAHYLKDFGYAQDKYIPEYFFWTSIKTRENLLECLLLGDGRLDSHRATGVSYKQKVYCTTSSRLAAGVERLAISLGYSVRTSRYEDNREERYLPTFEVRLLRHTERSALPKKNHYYTQQYSGMVYCATVPGGLLLVRRNGSVPIWLGNSEKTGITLHLPLGVRKEGNEAKTMVYDLKDDKIRYVGPAELHSEHIVLPDQVKWKKQKPVPIRSDVKMKDPRSHEIVEKPFSEGRFLLLTAHQLFDEATNLIPFLQNNQGNRTMTASRQATQAVGLFHREAPLVQVRSGSGHSWEKVIGSPWTHRAETSGKIVNITPNPQNGHADSITIQDSNGQQHVQQVYNHFPLNDSKSFMHSLPNVKVGDKVEKGQLLADSNYTKDGTLALGTNLRVTYLPYKGYNFEDGIVISESAAKKLTSEHMHRKSIEIDPEKDFVDKKKFISYASTASKKLSAAQLSKLGDDGIIHIGAKVELGDLLVAAVGKKNFVGETARMIGRLDKKMFSFEDKSVTWDSQHPGEVVKVVRSPNGKGATVFVKTLEPAEIGDKMVGRHGNKGIITRILPNVDMPRIGGPDGLHTEVLMNPSGVPTRLNLGQMLETASSKIALKTGTPYMVQNFGGADQDYSEKIKADLKSHGLSDEDDMYDAKTGKKLGSALNGHQYILKLKHQVEKKLAVRGGGNRKYEYSLDRSPKGTGASYPGQAIGQLEFYALLAHGARHNLREMATYKAEQHLGNNNDQSEHIDFWHRVQTGQPLPPPKAPFVYKKFEAMLTGLGINIRKDGHQLVLQPLTDKGVLALSAGEIIDPGRVLRGKDAKELEKGLFDPKVTGGLPNDVGKGLKWSHITLPESLPNPIFVGNKQHPGPAVSLSGLKFDEFEEVAKGQKSIKTPSGDMKTGGQAIHDILSSVQVKPEIKKLREQISKLRGTNLDKANKRLKYLIALDELGMKPTEAYMMKHIPVLPPIFRPIIPMQDGALRFDDINYYYKSLGHIIKQYKEAPKELGEEGIKELREDMYDITRSLAGLSGGTPVYESNRQMKGLLDTISGTQPKEGYFQKRLMKRRQDLSMRSTIIPEPAMHLDHVGLPRDAAMELYKPFVVREMQSLGYSPVEALKEIKAGSNLAWRSLQGAMDKRPVMLKRDPALHKFSIMAFKPKIVDGKAIKIHPLVTAGYNADFDGDSCLGAILTCNISSESGMGQEEKVMPHTGSIASFQVLEIRDFPRILESAVTKESGVIEYDVPDNTCVPAYNNGKMHIMPVTKFSIHPNCEEWVVKSRNGRDITCSADHSLALLDPETLTVSKFPPRNSTGKCFPVLRNLEEPGLYDRIPGHKLSSRGNVRQMLGEIPLVESVGWFIGAMVGDGWTSASTRQLHLASGVTPSVRDRWSKIVNWLSNGAMTSTRSMPHEFEGKNYESFRTTNSSTALSRWVEPLIGSGAHHKHLPPRFLEMPTEFRQGLLAGLLDTDGTVNWNSRGQFQCSYTTVSNKLAGEIMLLAISLGLVCNRVESENRERPVYIITFSIRPMQEATWLNLVSVHKQKALEELRQGRDIEFGRNDFVPITEQAREELLARLRKIGASLRPPNRNKEAFSTYVVLNRRDSVITRTTLMALYGMVLQQAQHDTTLSHLGKDTEFGPISEHLSKWFSIVLDKTVGWDVVEEAQATGQHVEMYDLTVPEAWTFTMANGAVVWDTMSAFVPLTDDAVRETFKMFPSNNLFSSTNGGIMYAPEQEAFLGLHLLSRWGKDSGKTFPSFQEAMKAKERDQLHVTDAVTINGHKTTLGRAIIAQHLPDALKLDESLNKKFQDPDFELHKKDVNHLLEVIAKNDPKSFAFAVDHLKDLGNQYSYELGFSFGLKDIGAHKSIRDPIIKKSDSEAAKVKADASLTPAQKHDKIVKIYDKATDDLVDAHRPIFEKEDNNMYRMVSSGARGKMSQFRQMTIAPMLMKDAAGTTLTTPVRKSYSEGLDVGDYWTSLHGARMGTLQRVEGTSEPGRLTKEIVNVVIPNMIVSKDCGTSNGIHMDIHDRDVHDRYLAASVKLPNDQVIQSGTLIDGHVTSTLKKHHIKQVVVRSPLKCNHGKGLCSKCFGLNENGDLHEIGTNIGVLAGHALGEPATQLAMDSFHTGGVASSRGGASVDKFTRLNQLLELPKVLPNAAVLAETSGKVTKVDRDMATNGWNVHIGKEHHYIPAQRTPTYDGQPLVVGTEVKKGEPISDGHIDPRDYLKHTDIHTVQNYLANELFNGIYKDERVRRRNIETVVRSLTNYTQIKDPGDSNYLHGDYALRTVVEEHNRNLPAGAKPIDHQPILKGAQQMALGSHEDWMARLNFQQLRNTLLEGTAKGWRTDLHGMNPIPAYAYGAEFGKGTPDKPHNY
jgi:DNA-directed RNA polymerase beta subunit/DNA-directed RNA polymerase beta' subunit